MPNWCNNVAIFTHSDPAMIQKIADVVNQQSDTGILQTFIPCPAELLDTTAGSFSDDAQQTALKLQEEQNLSKYGYRNWYDWQVANWGTKWDFCDVGIVNQEPNSIELSFQTAWSPPTEAYNKLLDLEFDISAYYYEPGMGFCGEWHNGCDESVELEGQTSNSVRSVISPELDNWFAIADSMAEWEAEQEEEEDLTEWIREGEQKQQAI